MDRSAPEYQGLLSEHKDGSLEDVRPPKGASSPPGSSGRSVTWLSCVAALFAIVVVTDVATLAYMWRMYHTVFRTTDVQDLEFADPYIGLADLYASGTVNASKIEPILIQPRVSAPVYRDQPHKHTPLGERDTWDDVWGTTSPNERHLHVDRTTTVARFPCPRASVHTFEVACAGDAECLVDVWSSQNRTWGMDIYQHQTI
ncbi:hypothetical protein PHLGIDRAFT_34312 [Phlebiopsis gigantea 11061_1 CR5-6]|uniref:Ubiquitin 3 binding protein But2 C-terminal domain-containing protein n=1 Tax=Phlebiopsis gigantea (strain 11061_1 CR5-6) TaxID=745531 RepID=A0A0C3SB19_PHLG1|nr:hypothetical protein PHLGIDRAFT_34312 [Phlebiopsis gigantea 11061_1 CR5-6]